MWLSPYSTVFESINRAELDKSFIETPCWSTIEIFNIVQGLSFQQLSILENIHLRDFLFLYLLIPAIEL